MDQKGPFPEPARGPKTRPILDSILVAVGSVLAPFWAPFWGRLCSKIGARFRSLFEGRRGTENGPQKASSDDQFFKDSQVAENQADNV